MVIKPSENTQLSSTRFPCIGAPDTKHESPSELPSCIGSPDTRRFLHGLPVLGLPIHTMFFCLHSCAAAECRISKPCNCYPQDKRMQRNSPSDMTKSLHKMLSSLFILPRHLPHKCLERYKHESPSARCLVIHDCSSMIFLYWVSQCTKIRYSHRL